MYLAMSLRPLSYLSMSQMLISSALLLPLVSLPNISAKADRRRCALPQTLAKLPSAPLYLHEASVPPDSDRKSWTYRPRCAARPACRRRWSRAWSRCR